MQITYSVFCFISNAFSKFYKAHTVSKCNIKSTKVKDILKHAEAIASKHRITKEFKYSILILSSFLSYSSLGTGTSIKSGGVKLVL
jgi:hypothetical protein